MKINCIVVDDEPLAQDILATYINKTPQLNLIEICNNAVEAFQSLHNNEIHLIFLDIQMPEITGVEFMKSLKNPPLVIFTTAYSEHAVEGFNLDAVDYLLKPISFERFLKSVNKVIELSKPQIKNSFSSENEFIFIKTDKKITRINLKDILYIEGLKDYVMIYTDSKRHVTLMTMKSLAQNLPINSFQRIHKSYIISLNKIKSIIGNSIEIGERLIPIGKVYRDDFFQIVEKHNLIK